MLNKIKYSENRRRQERAASYNTKYDRQLHKRISKSREKKLLHTILGRVGRRERILDVPAGTGRLSDVIACYGDRVYEVDYSREMLNFCRRNASGYRPLAAVATAFQLPFPDRAFDTVVSIRLSHHIPDAGGRRAHIRELLRVARRHVLVTFFGEETIKNRLRMIRSKLGSEKRGKYTLRRGDVADLARECGFRVVRFWLLSRLFSGHFYALLERTT